MYPGVTGRSLIQASLFTTNMEMQTIIWETKRAGICLKPTFLWNLEKLYCATTFRTEPGPTLP